MLENTSYLLAKKNKLTIGYFGGSITEGAGASSWSTCYRSKVNAWFRQQYPDAQINEIQASIGGTGSNLGMYRCEMNLLSKQPDLVFFEFAVNDNGQSFETVSSQTETIFRKILDSNPYADIITIFTTTEAIHNTMAEGGEYISRAAQSAVSHHYGIPSVDVGEVLRTKTLLEGGNFKKYTQDTVHPNDDGYSLYADCIISWLEKNLVNSDSMKIHSLPKPFSTKLYENAHLEDFYELAEYASEGFLQIDKTLCNRYPHYVEATKPGAWMSFTFTGEGLGFYWMLAKDSGDVSVQIDDDEPIHVRSWDKYCKGFNRAGGTVFASNLSYGQHRVKVTVLHEKAEESDGTAIRIGAVMIH